MERGVDCWVAALDKRVQEFSESGHIGSLACVIVDRTREMLRSTLFCARARHIGNAA